MNIDKIVKEWKARVKKSQTVLEGLEDEARDIAEHQSYAYDARSLIEDAQTGLETAQGDKASTEAEMLRAMALDDTESLVGLRERHASLAERETHLQGEIAQLTGVVEANTIDPSEVAALTTRLKRFRSPSAGDVVKAIKVLEEDHAKTAHDRVQATLEQLPTVDPRSRHAALKAADASYRTGEGKTLDEYLAAEDDAGRSEQATAMLASRLEARERRAVIAAR